MLARLDLPGILHRFLADPASARPAATALAAMLPRMLSTVEDGRARRLIARMVPRMLGGPGAGQLVARALHGLVEGGRHQEVFGFVLGQLRDLLSAKEDAMRIAIEERVREQGGRLVGWALGASIARRVLVTVNAELDKMRPDGSELRAAFDEWVRREIARHGGGPRPCRRGRRRHPPRGGARDGAGLVVGRLGAAAHGVGDGCRAPDRPYRGVYRGRAGECSARMLEADPSRA